MIELLHRLEFRPERSRPVWRNKHTGQETVVVDLAVDDRGGFQGGCRQFIVVTNEQSPPGPPPLLRWRPSWSLDSFLEHWEPTGRYIRVRGSGDLLELLDEAEIS